MKKGLKRFKRGQAALETALVSTLILFTLFGLLQFSLIQHARALTQYAAFNAVRTGSVNFGDCDRMTHAAVASLLPAIKPFTGNGAAATAYAAAFAARYTAPGTFKFNPRIDEGWTEDIVWIRRPSPAMASVPNPQAQNFDDPDPAQPRYRLEAEVVFWFPLRIAFANWLLTRILLAEWGIESFVQTNPIVNNGQVTDFGDNPQANPLDAAILAEYVSRIGAGHYVFPLRATYTMRMMTPVKKVFFATQNCPPVP